MKRKLLCTALCAIGIATAAQAADFTTTQGYTTTCAAMAAMATTNVPQDDDERVAFALCNDTALVRQIATWVDHGMKRMQDEKPSQQQIVDAVNQEVAYALERVAASRKALETIRLGKRKSLRLVPSQWQLDLNGDGKIDLWEKYFFAIPRRSDAPARFAMPSNDEAYYAREYNLDAAIKVDQSDVLWALSYHDFIESLLSLMQAYRPDAQFNFRLANPDMYRHAMEMYLQGLDNSEKTRRSVLAEKSNEEEWIANPKQTDSAFPVALDTNDFATWGKTLAQLKALALGKTLFGQPPRPGIAAQFELCPAGFGLDLHEMMQHPPATLNEVVIGRKPDAVNPYCRKVDAHHPLSDLATAIGRAQKTGQADAGMHMLRYLFWIN